ncbi:MAG TPA: heparinase II/III family protein [Candidatus Methylacidiphilales bacterium]|nr:heparinase II/III family protein [Candidatus Methylacidiphilales bacterium]
MNRNLFLAPAEWSALGAKLAEPFIARIAQDNLTAIRLYDSRRGASILEVPRDLQTDQPRLTLPYRVIKGRLLRAAVALHASHDESVWSFASETIDYLCRRDFWHMHLEGCRIRHFDLKLADLLYSACFVLDTFEGRLDAARRELLLSIMVEEGVQAYLRGWEARDWWREADFNWGAAIHGNAGLAALFLANTDPVLSGNVLDRARAGLGTLIDALPRDGWWTEGCMYHTTTLGHLSDFVIALHNTSGDDLGLSNNPRWFEALDSRRYCLAPDGEVFNFSNCSGDVKEWWCPHIYWWAERLGHPEWTAFEDSICKSWSDTHGVFHNVEAFLYRAVEPAASLSSATAAFRQPLDTVRHFRGLDWMTWRSVDGMWLAFRSGNNGGNHNNLDLGHFILGFGKTRYLIDPGYGFVKTAQHNAVTVRGKDQADCATARILHLGEQEGLLYISCDLTEAYPHALDYHVRTLLLVDGIHLFVIDHLAGRDQRRVSANYHFQTLLSVRPIMEHDANCASIDGPDGRLLVHSLSGHDKPNISSWKADDQSLTELRFTAAADLPQETSVLLLSFEPNQAPALEWNAAIHLAELTHTSMGKRWRISLNGTALPEGI